MRGVDTELDHQGQHDFLLQSDWISRGSQSDNCGK